MLTTEFFVVHSTGATKKVSKLSASFYRYKKQIAAGNMDPMSRVSVDATHPAVTDVHRHSGKAATVHETPPNRTSPTCLARLNPTPLVAVDWLAAVPCPWLVLVLPLLIVAAWDRQVLMGVV